MHEKHQEACTAGPGRASRSGGETNRMPDLAAMLLRKSVGALSSGRAHCSGCRRTPLVGERLHETDGGRQLCDLCVSRMPESDRRFVGVERVHASERHLSVAPHVTA